MTDDKRRQERENEHKDRGHIEKEDRVRKPLNEGDVGADQTISFDKPLPREKR